METDVNTYIATVHIKGKHKVFRYKLRCQGQTVGLAMEDAARRAAKLWPSANAEIGGIKLAIDRVGQRKALP